MILACNVFQLDTRAALVPSSWGAGKPAGSGKAGALHRSSTSAAGDPGDRESTAAWVGVCYCRCSFLKNIFLVF